MSRGSRTVAVLMLIAVVCLMWGATWPADALHGGAGPTATLEEPSGPESWPGESDQEDGEAASPTRDVRAMAPRGPVDPVPSERNRRSRPDLPPQLDQLL